MPDPRPATPPPWVAWLPQGSAVLLSSAGGALIAALGQPAWTTLAMLALLVLALGEGRARWVLAVLGIAVAGWSVGLGLAVATDPRWSVPDILTWAGALLVLLLAAAVAGLSGGQRQRLRTERDTARQLARDAVVHDPLTSLANRKGLEMLGGQILESARRRGDAVYCMFLDVDGLARVNAEISRSAGDQVLLTVADAVAQSTRATDAVARWGDDEFVVLGPGTGLAPLEMERRVRVTCLERSPVSQTVWPARISAGGAVLEPWDDGDIDSLLRQADREMQLRRTMRREAAGPAYQPVRHDPSPKPPEPRH
jgi:diguanylate cyclase (GGDEF)-like protein